MAGERKPFETNISKAFELTLALDLSCLTVANQSPII